MKQILKGFSAKKIKRTGTNMGRRTESGQPVSSSRVQGRKKNLKTNRRGPRLITKGYAGSLAVGLKRDLTARTYLPQRDGGGERGSLGDGRSPGGSPTMVLGDGDVSRRLQRSFLAALDRRRYWRRSGTAALHRVLGAPASRYWATEREREGVMMSGRERVVVRVRM
jgi:hypothetical protein